MRGNEEKTFQHRLLLQMVLCPQLPTSYLLLDRLRQYFVLEDSHDFVCLFGEGQCEDLDEHVCQYTILPGLKSIRWAGRGRKEMDLQCEVIFWPSGRNTLCRWRGHPLF